jgi:HK97 family phage major capsid protein
MEAFVSQELTNKANLVMDNSIINGAFTNNYGLKGIITSTDSIDVGSVTLSAISLTNLHNLVASVLPELQAGSMFVIAPATWAQLLTSFLDADNLNSQLITDGAVKTLLGYPVKVSVVMPTATPIVFGNFGQYLIGVNRDVSIEVDRSAGFLTDVTAVKVGMRLAGGPACSKKQYNGTDYAAFAYISA